MKIKNLTSQTAVFYNENNEIILKIEPEEKHAYCKKIRKDVGYITANDIKIKVWKHEYGEVINLPEPEEDTIFIVPVSVAKACPDREDVFIGDEFVKDKDNNYIGLRSLAYPAHK